MSNRRKLREFTGYRLTRPRDQWAGKVRGRGYTPPGTTAAVHAQDRLRGVLSALAALKLPHRGGER